MNALGVEIHRDHFAHAREIGDTRVISVRRGRFYVSLQRYTGVYGQRHTVTYGLMWSASW